MQEVFLHFFLPHFLPRIGSRSCADRELGWVLDLSSGCHEIGAVWHRCAELPKSVETCRIFFQVEEAPRLLEMFRTSCHLEVSLIKKRLEPGKCPTIVIHPRTLALRA